MNVLFTFENALSSTEADAEVFVTTASYLQSLFGRSWLHAPGPDRIAGPPGIEMVRAPVPRRPAVLRHLCCGLAMVTRRAFRQADLVYTRNLWIASMALLFGKPVVFDHYRPWPDQIPPLKPWIRALMGHPRFLLNICHSDYTRGKYLELGVPPARLVCIRNGFEPRRLHPRLTIAAAKSRIGVPPGRSTVVYTGRLNHRKGLGLLIEAAGRLPGILFILVGSAGDGSIEALTREVANIRIVPWQRPEALAPYLFAADVLVIPPSTRPLAEFGSTVLPLKLFLYMASGRPILAGATPDVREVLRHRENAFLCHPDCLDALVDGLETLIEDEALAERLGANALAESGALTWETRATRIAAAIEERRRAAPVASDRPSRQEMLVWLRQSARWLAHLARSRSFILPPDDVGPRRAEARGFARPPHRRRNP